MFSTLKRSVSIKEDTIIKKTRRVTTAFSSTAVLWKVAAGQQSRRVLWAMVYRCLIEAARCVSVMEWHSTSTPASLSSFLLKQTQSSNDKYQSALWPTITFCGTNFVEIVVYERGKLGKLYMHVPALHVQSSGVGLTKAQKRMGFFSEPWSYESQKLRCAWS